MLSLATEAPELESCGLCRAFLCSGDALHGDQRREMWTARWKVGQSSVPCAWCCTSGVGLTSSFLEQIPSPQLRFARDIRQSRYNRHGDGNTTAERVVREGSTETVSPCEQTPLTSTCHPNTSPSQFSASSLAIASWHLGWRGQSYAIRGPGYIWVQKQGHV